MGITIAHVISIVIIAAVFLQFVEGGSLCPPRENLYPCLCTNAKLSKTQMLTDVTCRHILHVDSLDNIFQVLRNMHIDRFIIYDSFWGDIDHSKKRLSNNWFSLLKIKELSIIDSEISHDIACGDKLIGCPNNVPVSLSIINSSSTDNFTTMCQQGKVSFSWISCMGKLKTINFNQNKLKTIGSDFFEKPMTDLVTVNFSRNVIRKIEKGAFRNLEKMTILDLSHNMITDIEEDIFGNVRKLLLTHLDISSNFLNQLSSNIFEQSPYLKFFSAAHNRIQKLPFKDWQHISENIRTVDLTGNPLECDCHIIWINCTFHINVAISGSCINEEYANSQLRRVSKFMSERCEDGVLTKRENKTKRNACTDWEKNKIKHLELPTPQKPRQHLLTNKL